MPTIKLHELPVDILIVIIQKLCLVDVRNLFLTCKTLNNLITNDNVIWRSICRTRFIIHEQGKNNNSSLSWYNRCRISYNWCKAIYKNKGLIYHNTYYMPWLKFPNSEALLLTVGPHLHCYPVDRNGFPNNRHLQWYLSMPKIKRYDKRTNDISRFVFKDNLLVCGNRNGSAAVYKVDSINKKPHLTQYIKDCHEDGRVEVSAVDIVENRENIYMVTASTGSPIVLFWSWDAEDECLDFRDASHCGSSFGIDLGHNACEGAKCLALNEKGDKLAIGPDGNSKPVLIDLNKAEFVIKSDDSVDANQIVQDIQWHNENTLCYVTHSGWLQIMDIRTHEVVYDTEDPFQAGFYCVRTDGHHAIVAGTSQHSRCVLFDTRKTQHAQLYFTQQLNKKTPVYSLDFDSTKLIAAADRGVAALNFNVSNSTIEPRDYSDVFGYIS